MSSNPRYQDEVDYLINSGEFEEVEKEVKEPSTPYRKEKLPEIDPKRAHKREDKLRRKTRKLQEWAQENAADGVSHRRRGR